jgi:hypothetical protein
LPIGQQDWDEETSSTVLPDGCRVLGDLGTLITSIYEVLQAGRVPPPEYFTDRTILATRNDDVDIINEKVLAQFPGREEILIGVNSVVEDDLNIEAVGLRQQRD